VIPAIVVTYKNPELLKRCTDSLAGQAAAHVEDNSENNRLYTVAVNDGLKRFAFSGEHPYVLICCDDVIVQPGAVAALAAYLDSDPKAGMACPVQLDTKGKVTCGGCTDAFPYGKHIIEPLTHELYRKPYESFWGNGACFMLRSEAVRECGLLDRNMKFICSDSDYSFTLRSRGWTIMMVPEAKVTHEPNGALKTANAFLEKTKDQDSLYFISKWLSGVLFQGLAHEGKRLTAKDIENQLMVLNWRLQEGYKVD